MKTQISGLSMGDHNRFAINDYIHKNNPLRPLIQSHGKPSTLSASSLLHSHLSVLSLDKGSHSSAAHFCPPGSISTAEYVFSELFYHKLEVAEKLYRHIAGSSAISSHIGVILQDFFATTKTLHALFQRIQSQRLGIQQG